MTYTNLNRGLVPTALGSYLNPYGQLGRLVNNPLNVLKDLENQFSNAFSDNNAGIEVNETDTAYEIIAEVVGLTSEEIAVEMLDKTLTIVGTRASDESEDKPSPGKSRNVSYRVVLPSKVIVEDITAELSNGLLTLKAPKVAPPSAVTIPVRSL